MLKSTEVCGKEALGQPLLSQIHQQCKGFSHFLLQHLGDQYEKPRVSLGSWERCQHQGNPGSRECCWEDFSRANGKPCSNGTSCLCETTGSYLCGNKALFSHGVGSKTYTTVPQNPGLLCHNLPHCFIVTWRMVYVIALASQLDGWIRESRSFPGRMGICRGHSMCP